MSVGETLLEDVLENTTIDVNRFPGDVSILGEEHCKSPHVLWCLVTAHTFDDVRALTVVLDLIDDVLGSRRSADRFRGSLVVLAVYHIDVCDDDITASGREFDSDSAPDIATATSHDRYCAIK
jgi:hypothetical protein